MLCDDLNRMPENQRQEHMKVISIIFERNWDLEFQLIISQHEDEIEKSYGKKLQVIKKDMKSLVYVCCFSESKKYANFLILGKRSLGGRNFAPFTSGQSVQWRKKVGIWKVYLSTFQRHHFLVKIDF